MNKMHLPLSIVVIATFILLGMTTTALAAEVNNGNETPVPFTHTMYTNPATDLAGITYTIGITGLGADSTVGSYAATGVDVATLPFVNGVITPATPNPSTRSDSTESTKSWAQSLSLAQLFGDDNPSNADADGGYAKFAANFPQAGIYKFSISETRTGADADKWSYTPADDGGYTLTVWIENNSDDLTKHHYDGWVLKDKDGEKIDVVTTTGSEAGADFSSKYTAKSTLRVTKQVEGDYASTTYAFPQEITLYLPDWAADADDIRVSGGQVGTGDGWNTETGTTRVYKVSLAHGETVTFENLPVGTRYSVDEKRLTDAAGLTYSAQIAWDVDAEAQATERSFSYVPLNDIYNMVTYGDFNTGSAGLPENIASTYEFTGTIDIETDWWDRIEFNDGSIGYRLDGSLTVSGSNYSFGGGFDPCFDAAGNRISTDGMRDSTRVESVPEAITDRLESWENEKDLQLAGYHTITVTGSPYYEVEYRHSAYNEYDFHLSERVTYDSAGNAKSPGDSYTSFIPGIEINNDGYYSAPKQYLKVEDNYYTVNYDQGTYIENWDDMPDTFAPYTDESGEWTFRDAWAFPVGDSDYMIYSVSWQSESAGGFGSMFAPDGRLLTDNDWYAKIYTS